MSQNFSDDEPYFECERCEVETLPKHGDHIEVGDERYLVCDGCVEGVRDDIERYMWSDRYTKEHHEKAVEKLEEQDEILCIDDNYDAGEIWVHTKYVSAEVVMDVMEHFSLRPTWWGPRWQEEETWDCLEEHGSCFEICLEYTRGNIDPLPVEAPFHRTHSEYLDENDKQF